MTAQDPELSAALGWPGGISDPVLDRTRLLQMAAALRLASQQALEVLRRATPADSAQAREQLAALAALSTAVAHQAEPVEPVATLTAQRDALLEALKYHQEQTRPIQRTLDVIKAVEEGK